MKRDRSHYFLNLTFILLWMALLFASLAFKISAKALGWPNFDIFVISENREHERKPAFRELPVKEWGAAVDAWYNDNFAWRSRLIQFYRFAHFNWLKTSVAREVPGLDGWVFRRGGDWAELDDYLGGFELTEQELADWVLMFEGRKQWAEAHGTRYLQLITSVKAQTHPEKIFPMIRRHRGVGVGAQVRQALAASSARDHVVFVNEPLAAAIESGREVFYPVDHHVNAYGIYLLYRELVDRMRQNWFPEITMPPFYDDPPQAVLAGEEAGCFVKNNKLKVITPGATNVEHRLLEEWGSTHRRYPMVHIALQQPGEHRSIVMGHDSFMRFSLTSWNERDPPTLVTLPFGDGFDHIFSFIFTRFSTHRLNLLLAGDVPDVIIEQFPECRLNMNINGYDAVMRNAALFGRAKAIAPEAPPAAEQPVRILVTLDQVTDEAGERIPVPSLAKPPVKVVLLRDDVPVAETAVYHGVRRAVFFDPVEYGSGVFSVRLENGRCERVQLELRVD